MGSLPPPRWNYLGPGTTVFHTREAALKLVSVDLCQSQGIFTHTHLVKGTAVLCVLGIS